MKKSPVKQSHNVFHQVRKVVTGAFENRKMNARLERGAELFVKQHSRTMEMLAKESDHA
jgi:hypothetical protein